MTDSDEGLERWGTREEVVALVKASQRAMVWSLLVPPVAIWIAVGVLRKIRGRPGHPAKGMTVAALINASVSMVTLTMAAAVLIWLWRTWMDLEAMGALEPLLFD